MIKALSVFVAALAAVLIPSVTMAQLAAKPVVLIVPFAAGGNLDLIARIIAPAMMQHLGRTVVVQNKVGAGGVIGTTVVARAEPDGSTLLVTTPNAIVVTPRMMTTSYSLNSFVSAGMISSTSLALVVRSDNKRFGNFAELIAYAKANPGKVTMGNSSIGTTNHVAILVLQDVAGVDFNIITYKGSGPATIDLLGGQIEAMVDQLSSSYPHVKAGRLRALAVMSNQRDPLLPDVPGSADLGLPALDVSTLAGILAPAGTPAPVIAAINGALNKALAEENVRRELLNIGSVARPGPADAFTALLHKEDAVAARLAAAGKLKSE